MSAVLLTILVDVEFMLTHFVNLSAVFHSYLYCDKEYLSEMFCSFIYLGSHSSPLVLFSFLLFCLFSPS